jgi:hypothetical protein
MMTSKIFVSIPINLSDFSGKTSPPHRAALIMVRPTIARRRFSAIFPPNFVQYVGQYNKYYHNILVSPGEKTPRKSSDAVLSVEPYHCSTYRWKIQYLST